MSELTGENELLRASLAGNREAFGAIVERYQSLVCAITYSATGDIGRSEELAQETFIRVWRNLSQLSDAAKFRAWLCTIARNLANASIRKRSKDAVYTAGRLDETDGVASAWPDPSQTAIDKEHREMVWSCLGMFFVLLLPLIFWGNARQRRIQSEEGTCRRPGPTGPASITRQGLYASFGGGIFGGTAWMLSLAWIARDWASIGVVLACDILLLLIVTAITQRDRKRYESVATWMVCVLLAMTLTVVNLRWTAWMRAYRQSTVYDPMSDVSLTTINLIVLGVFTGLFVLFAARYVCHRDGTQCGSV